MQLSYNAIDNVGNLLIKPLNSFSTTFRSNSTYTNLNRNVYIIGNNYTSIFNKFLSMVYKITYVKIVTKCWLLYSVFCLRSAVFTWYRYSYLSPRLLLFLSSDTIYFHLYAVWHLVSHPLLI